MRAREPWGTPLAAGTPLVDVDDDAAIAAAALAQPGAVLRVTPGSASELARALGLGGRPASATRGATVVACDVLDLGAGLAAANMAIAGVAPDRLTARHRRRRVTVEVDGRTVFDGVATTVVVANGQFLRGADLVPRGHPGDGRCEVQVYALAPGERRGMRQRLAGGHHLPHPRITQASGRRVEVRWRRRGRSVEADGRRLPARPTLGVAVRPGAARLVV